MGAFVEVGVGGTDEGSDGNIRIEVFASHLLSSSAVIGPMYVGCGALVDSSRTASSLGCRLSVGKYAAISKYTSWNNKGCDLANEERSKLLSARHRVASS
jgi:hypothetical protein